MSRLGLIGRNRVYGLLWIGRTASMLGSMATLYALLLYLKQTGASPTQVGFVLAVRALPQALGPLAGTLSDRVDARKLMVLCDLGQAAAVGAVALFLPPYWLLVALIATYSVFSALFLPAGKGAIPRLVSRDELTQANALMGTSFNLAVAVGPALARIIHERSVGLRFACRETDEYAGKVADSLHCRLQAYKIESPLFISETQLRE